MSSKNKLKFNVTDVRKKTPYGILISGVLENGSLIKNNIIYIYDESNVLIQKSVIDEIYNNGIKVNQFSAEEKARRLKFTIKDNPVKARVFTLT
jgi:hypothetical protein